MRTPLYKSRPVEPNPATIGGERINDFIVLSEAFSNCYLLETSDGNIQVNAGMGIEAPVIKRNFDSFSDAPVRYLIFTQGHVDHVGGTGYLREQHGGLKVIATAENPAHQEYDARLASFRANRSAFAFTEKFAAAFEQYGAAGYTEFPVQDAPTPDILFEDEYRLTLGELELELIAVPGAETNDSLIIWLPQHRICLTGNLFGCPFGHFPNLVTIRGDRYRDALTVAAAVERVRALEPETILYGHHGPVRGAELIQSELTALHGAILHVHDETVKGMNEGKDLHTLMSGISLPAEFEVGQGYGKVSWSVRAIWENYAGWFKHDSTTELYTVPQSAVHADLVELAGGSDAIVERAESKLAEGRLEEAIHLLELLSPADARVNAALRGAHERLLESSENFWLTSWLRNQLRVLEAASGS